MSDSIWYHKPGEFRQLIHGFDKSITVTEALGEFREFRTVSKEFKPMTIQEIVDNNLIEDLANSLLAGMKAESKFQLQYSKQERIQELIENLADRFYIDKNKAEVKIVTGRYKNPDMWQTFSYCLEAMIAPLEDAEYDCAGCIEIIGCINSSRGKDGGSGLFDGPYHWWDKKGRAIESTSVREILQECGYTASHYESISKKKVPSVLYINLWTPCPDFLGGAGKTQIDIRPYAEDIARTVSTLAYKMPSYHGRFSYPRYDYEKEKRKSAISYLEDFLNDRYDAVQGDPSLKYRDPLTQSGVWYRIRPIMIENGFEPEKDWGKTRTFITSQIDKKCNELFDLEREDLGIYAKARGMMLYDGNIYPVDYKTFEALGAKGVFILVIEKEGIADVLKDVARDSGVALVHTGGKFSKYVKLLIEKAGVPCATLTDYDADGVTISNETISETPRIGIDRDIVTWLQQNGYPELRQESIEEEYTPRIEPEDEYLKHHRIELDSIIAAFPNNPGRGPEALWKYIKYKIEEQQKEEGFNYNNVIDNVEPDSLYPTALKDLISIIESYIEEITEAKTGEIEKEQESVKKLISIKDKELENLSILENVVSDDETIQEKIIPILEKVNQELSKMLDGEDIPSGRKE